MTRTRVVTVVSVLLALLFLASGFSKIAGADMQVQSFERWGYPLWFMYLTGLLELLGAALLLIPAARFLGGLVLACVMAGAVGTQLMFGEFALVPVPAVLLVLVAWVGWVVRPPGIEYSHLAGEGRPHRYAP